MLRRYESNLVIEIDTDDLILAITLEFSHSRILLYDGLTILELSFYHDVVMLRYGQNRQIGFKNRQPVPIF